MTPQARHHLEQLADRALVSAQRAAAWLGWAAFVGFFFAIVFAGSARAQVTDKPITSWPTEWTGTVWHSDLTTGQACVGGWLRPNRYSDFVPELAFVDPARLLQKVATAAAIDAKDIPALVKARTQDVYVNGVIDPAAKPCDDRLITTMPPAPWTVAASSTGKRPAYLLNADKTRGAQSGTAATTITIAGQTMPMWCSCIRHSVETTASTYCPWADWRQTQDPQEPVRVTLCREAK